MGTNKSKFASAFSLSLIAFAVAAATLWVSGAALAMGIPGPAGGFCMEASEFRGQNFTMTSEEGETAVGTQPLIKAQMQQAEAQELVFYKDLPVPRALADEDVDAARFHIDVGGTDVRPLKVGNATIYFSYMDTNYVELDTAEVYESGGHYNQRLQKKFGDEKLEFRANSAYLDQVRARAHTIQVSQIDAVDVSMSVQLLGAGWKSECYSRARTSLNYTYDRPSADNTDEWIDRVEFGRLDHTSGKSEQGYADYTYRGTGVAPGGEYELISTAGMKEASDQYTHAWIDWNEDTYVNDSETYDLGDCSDEGCTVADVIEPPADQSQGTPLLRLIQRRDDPPTGFYDDVDSGEVLDYSVDFGPANRARYDAVEANDTDVHISRVRMSNLDHTSGRADQAGYQDHTSEIAHVAPAEEIPLAVDVQGSTDVNVSVWIDWNKNDFLESWERYDLEGCTATCKTGDRVDVPTFAKPGPTVMRVTATEGAPPAEPRGDLGSGQVVDYTVNINSAYADSEEFDFVFADNRDTWIRGVEVADLNDVNPRQTVVDFNWAYPECRNQGVTQLDEYFYPDSVISGSDGDFHEDDGAGVDNYQPAGECFLRTDADAYKAIFSDPDAADAEQNSTLPHYPVRGERIEYRQYVHRSGDDYGDFYFGRQDADNYYLVRLDDTNTPSLALYRSVGGTEEVIASANPSIPSGQFHQIEVDWGTGHSDVGTIEVTFTNGADRSATTTISAHDANFDSGGIGFGKANAGTTYSYAHLWDRVTVDGKTRAEVFDRVELFGQRGHEDRTYMRGEVAPGGEYEMDVHAEGADGVETYATAFFDWNRNQYLGPDIANAFTFLDDFEYGYPDQVDRPSSFLVDNYADTDDPEYVPVGVDDFGQADEPYRREVVDFNWPSCSDAGSLDQQPLSDYYYLGGGVNSDFALRLTNGGNSPNVTDDDCTMFFEGADWSGNPSWAFSMPDGANPETLSYYPAPGETITYREAYFRGTDLMFIFGAQNENEFYGVYVEAWSDTDGDYTVPVELRKYTGGIGGSYTTLASDSFTMNDQEWIDRDDEAIWTYEVHWHTVTDGDIDVEATRPDGTTAFYMTGSDSEYGRGGIGHWSDRGTHNSWGTTYSNAGYHIDVEASGEGCSINADAYEGDTSGFQSQSSVTSGGSECALYGNSSNTTMVSTFGLDAYPQRGERIRYEYRPEGTDTDGTFRFGVQSLENSYAIRKDVANDDLVLERWEGGGKLQLASTNVNFDVGSWHEVEVDWGGPTESHTINVTVYDSTGTTLGSLSADDGRFDDGGVGYSVADGSGSPSYWDSVRTEQPQLFTGFRYENETTHETFGSADQKFETTVVDYNWNSCSGADTLNQQPLDDYYYLGGGDSGDFELRLTNGGNSPNVTDDDCALMFEGADWSGGESWIFSMPGAGNADQNKEINYYPKRGDNITYREAHYRGTDMMFMFAAEDENNFYGVYIEAWDDTGDGSYDVPIELREYTGGIGGSYDTVDSTVTSISSTEWLDRDDSYLFTWRIDFDSQNGTADNYIRAELYDDTGSKRATLEGYADRHNSGGIGHWSDRGTHSSFGVTYSHAGYHVDVEAEGIGCVLSDKNYNGDLENFVSQGTTTYSTNECALRVESSGSQMYSMPGDGLPNYPDQGDRIKFYFRSAGGAGEYSFGVQDDQGQSRYRARVNPSNDELRLDKFEGGDSEFLSWNSSVPLSNDTWYEIRVDWGTEITLSAHDPSTGDLIGSTAAIDREYTDGGVGYSWEVASGDVKYWDDVRIENRYGYCSLDDYDGDVGEYEARQYIEDDPTCQLSTNTSNGTISSVTGLNKYPERGDNIRFDYWLENPDIHSEFLFGYQDENNYYALNLTDKVNGFQLVKVESGVRTVLDQANLTGQVADEEAQGAPDSLYDLGPPGDYPRHDVNIQWGGIQPGDRNVSNETISARIFQYDETKWMGSWFPVYLEANDSTFDTGGIGFRKERNESDSLYWDDVRVDNCDTYGYRGDREYIYAQDSVVSTGQCALEAGPEATDNQIFSSGSRSPRDSVAAFAERGDTLRFDYRYEEPTDPDGSVGQFYFGPNPSRAGDTYGLQIHPEAASDQFMLFRCDCGDVINSVSSNVDLRPDVWYTVEIAWGRGGADDPEIAARMFGPEGQVADVSMTDGYYDQGDIGFRKVHGEGTRIWFDDVRVFEGESRFNLGSCTIQGDSCTITGDIVAPTNAQGGSVLMRTVLTEGGYAAGPYDDVGNGEVVDYTLNVETALEPKPEEAFVVNITSTNSPVTEGGNLTVDAQIESTKNGTETQEITLETAGIQRDATNVTLDPGAVTNVTLVWQTEVGDEGFYTAEVSSVDDSDTADVELTGADAYPASEGDASFEWVEHTVFSTIDHTSGQGSPDGYQNFTGVWAEVDQGGNYTLNVTAAAANEGDTQYVTTWFDWDQSYELDTREDVGACNPTIAVDTYYVCYVETTVEVPVTAAPNDTRMRVIQEFDEWPDGPYQEDFFGQTVDYTANVTEVDFQPATFEIVINDTDSPIVEGDTLQVNATVENVGEEPGTKNATLEVPDGTERDRQELTLDPGEIRNVTLNWATQKGDSGNYTAWAKTPDDSDSSGVTVEEGANFTLSYQNDNDPVEEGETYWRETLVENTGPNPGTQDVEFLANGSVVDTVTVSLDPGNTQLVNHTVGTQSGDAGTYNGTVRSDDEWYERLFTVQQPAFFSVTIDGTNSPVDVGDALLVNVTVTNTGDATDTGDVELYADAGQTGTFTQEDLVVDSLNGGETRQYTLEWKTGQDDNGTADLKVETYENDTGDFWDSDSTTADVQQSAFFDVTITGTNEPVVEGEDLYVDAEINNTGKDSDTQDIDLDINGTIEDTVTGVSLAAGESTNVTLNYNTVVGDFPALDATVLSADDSDSTTVQMMETLLITDFEGTISNQLMVDYDTGWGSNCASNAEALDQAPISTHYYIGNGDPADGELRTGNGGSEPAIGGDCILFWEGTGWSGNAAWIWSDTELSGHPERITYYPGRGDTIHWRAAYYRSTTQMFMFGARNENEFYAVHSETPDNSGNNVDMTVSLRKYTGGVGGSYTTLAQGTYQLDDQYWVEQNPDNSVFDIYVEWHTVTDGDIDVEIVNPDGNQELYISGNDNEYGAGNIGHYSTDGSFSCYLSTCSSAGFDVDFHVDSNCGIDRSNWFGDTAVYHSQNEFVQTGSCALQGYANNTQIFSSDGAGLGTYPERGDKIMYWTRSETATDGSEFMFGVQDDGNYYVVRLFPDGNELRLDKWVGGTGSFLTWNTSANIQADQWYEVKIDWGASQNDVIAIDVVDTSGNVVGSVETTDTEYSDGGIGFQYDRFDGPGEVYWDDVRIGRTR